LVIMKKIKINHRLNNLEHHYISNYYERVEKLVGFDFFVGLTPR